MLAKYLAGILPADFLPHQTVKDKAKRSLQYQSILKGDMMEKDEFSFGGFWRECEEIRRLPERFLTLNLPMQVTSTRIPLAVIAGLSITLNLDAFAVAIFIIASLTDAADGYLARTLGLGTEKGKTFDYMADKYLVLLCLIALTITGRLHPIFFILVSFREAAVVALRLYSARKGTSRLTEVDGGGKLKMIVQCIAISWTIVGFPGYQILMTISVLLTYTSFTQYLRKYWAQLGNAKEDCNALWEKIKNMSVAE